MVFTTISDDVAIGAQMMQELATLIGGKGNIYMFHDPSYGLLVNREKGAEQVLAKYPDIHVVQRIQIQPVNTLGVGRDNWENILTAHPTKGSIAGLWSPADEASVGAAQAEWAANRTEIPVVSCDGTPAGLAEMKKSGSPLKYEVVQDFAGQSQGVAKVISDYFNGTKPTNSVQTYASILVTDQEVQSGQYPPAATTPTT
jgi:ribose transport system substrate-binding protein